MGVMTTDEHPNLSAKGKKRIRSVPPTKTVNAGLSLLNVYQKMFDKNIVKKNTFCCMKSFSLDSLNSTYGLLRILFHYWFHKTLYTKTAETALTTNPQHSAILNKCTTSVFSINYEANIASPLMYNEYFMATVNILYFGSPCLWLKIDRKDNAKLKKALERELINENDSEINSCNFSLAHTQRYIVSPIWLSSNGIKFEIIQQNQGDVIYFQPFVYFQLLTLGPNFSETINIQTTLHHLLLTHSPNCAPSCIFKKSGTELDKKFMKEVSTTPLQYAVTYKKIRKYPCKLCDRICYGSKELFQHRQKEHANVECSHCNRQFNNSHKYLKHSYIHLIKTRTNGKRNINNEIYCYQCSETYADGTTHFIKLTQCHRPRHT